MSIQTILDDIRVELTDKGRTRWKDDTELTALVDRAIRRINGILAKNHINFAREYKNVTLKTDGTIEDFPAQASIMRIFGLYRDDAKERIIHLWPSQWEVLKSCTAAQYWAVVNQVAVYREASSVEIPATFIYYPKIEIDPVESPWEGLLDDQIVEYASYRAKNIDEMTLQQDLELLKELEITIIDNYKGLEPNIGVGAGWNTGG